MMFHTNNFIDNTIKEPHGKKPVIRHTKTFSISLTPKVFDMLVMMKEAEGATSLSAIISNAISTRYEQKEALKQFPTLISVYNEMKAQEQLKQSSKSEVKDASAS